MTFRPSAPHKRSRWLALLVVATSLLVLAASFASAHGVASVPARYAGGTQVDIDPPPGPAVNDVPGQVDMTQMGRDTSANPDIRIFWSWDSISAWAGNGQTGDACALFDTADADAFINYVVCARVQNNGTPGDVVLLPASANHPVYLFDCSNKKDDRCTNPAARNYTPGQVLAGPLTAADNTLTQTGAGDLITETDPFNATFLNGPGESYPHDTSLEILVDDSLVPATVRLANVCSYPSAGNGGNNNPFDCVVTPGVQYGTLIVNKTLINDNGGTALVTSFNFTVGSGTATTGVVASTAFEADASNSLTLPVGTYSVAEVGTPITGYTTSYSNCTSVSVTAGGSATCTITNNDQAATLIVKKLVVNDNGGTKVATDFSFQVNGATAVAFLQDPNDADTKKGQNTLTVDAGTYSVTEPAVSGYTTTYSNCTSVVIANGGSATCTITNNDQAATLIVKKLVVNDNGGTKVATDFSFQVNGATAVAFLQDPNDADTKKGHNTLTVDAGTYSVTEPAVSGYSTTYSNCTSVVIANGGSATCTITNNDQAATPAIATVMKWTLNDRTVMTGWRSGGTASTVTFSLYKDSGAMTSCEAQTFVTSFTVNVNDADGSASTTTHATPGYTTESAGTYRWVASFSGNSFNAAIATTCGDEVTTLP